MTITSRKTYALIWVALSTTLKRSLIAKISEPDIFDRYRQHVVDELQPRATIALPFQSATVSIPVDRLVFQRPPGRQHVITEAEDVVTVSSAGCEFQLERSFRPLLASIFQADSFSMNDLLKAHPGISSDDLADLFLVGAVDDRVALAAAEGALADAPETVAAGDGGGGDFWHDHG